jgi:hypothetical protein
MTETTFHPSPIDVGQRAGLAIAATAAALCGAMATIVLIRFDQGPVWRVSLVMASVVVAIAWLVVRKVHRVLATNDAAAAGRHALLFGVLTFVSALAFWVAVPPVFAAAAVLTARATHRQTGATPWQAALGLMLAAIGFTAGLAFALVG